MIIIWNTKIIETFLISNNFILNKKEQSKLIKKFPKSFHESYNQIWINDGKANNFRSKLKTKDQHTIGFWSQYFNYFD